MNKYDLVFLKHFAMVIAVLFAIMIVLIIGARWIYLAQPAHENPARAAEVGNRIAPVGDVYAGDSGRQAMVAAEEAAKAAAAGQVAYDGTLDGSVIYGKLCTACHTSGVAGAPAMTTVAWADRIAQGEETLIKHAIEGFQGKAGLMPAKGGNPALTDEQVAETVKWMLANLK